MLTKTWSDKEKITFITFLAKGYMNSMRRVHLYRIFGVQEGHMQYEGELGSLYLVDSALRLCSSTSEFILRNEFFGYSKPNWYRDYYSKSSFYRLKKQAIDEFIDCLNL
ncbi:MG284/MPN403 family protein [Anaerorhabdus sp.]|uniref:MG284/MPN403 family protein n=1 Tax=Anaerorhabdus sp. TaxID=1872524 RepID=UPI002FCC71BE